VGLSSPGIGSNLDVNGIVTKLMSVESQPLQTLATKEASYQAKLSAYGSLNGALSAFQSSLSGLSSSDKFQSYTAAVTDIDIFSATATSKAVAGTYDVSVTKLAQAQTIATAGQLSSTSSIGDGTPTTLTFQFGTIAGGTLSSGLYTGATFSQDSDKASGSVTIDAGNNSLQGIRDAVNKANIGVTASIVSDGSDTPYHLIFTSSKTGASSSMKIDVSGDQSSPLAGLLAYDPAGTQNLTQSGAAQNTELTVNGIAITSATRDVTDAIQGTTLTVAKTGDTTLTVARNTSSVQSAVSGFVQAYNDLNGTLKNLTSYDADTKVGGVLLGDSATLQIQSQLRNMLSKALPGTDGGLTSLPQIGITFAKDGSMTLDSAKLQSAITDHFNDIGNLFATMGTPSDSLINYLGSSTKTQAGQYAVNITTLATQGKITGSAAAGLTITAGENDQLSMTVDGTTASVSLLPGTYTAASLAANVQAAINGNSTFSSRGIAVSVAADQSGIITITSNRYGSASNVSVGDNGAANLLGAARTSTAGIDVAGSISGVEASGSGQILTGAAGSANDGLKLEITGGSLGDRGAVNFSRGFAYQLDNLIGNYTGSSGLITLSKNGANNSIKDIGDARDALNTKLAALQKRYLAQFSALDTLIGSMTQTQSFLTQQLEQISNLSKQSI
jgi:flagellar hook-associated protein 2